MFGFNVLPAMLLLTSVASGPTVANITRAPVSSASISVPASVSSSYQTASTASTTKAGRTNPPPPASVTTFVSTHVPLTIQVGELKQPEVSASAPVSLSQVSDKIKEAVNESPSVGQVAIEYAKNFIKQLPYITVGFVIFILFWLLSALFNKVLKKIFNNHPKYKSNFSLVVRRLGSSFILLLGLVFSIVVALPGFTPSKLLSALGFGSVMLGFAFKDFVQNLMSGILLLINEPFQIGDQIIVNNYEGTVENVQMRATTICTYDNRRIVIPNAEIYKLAVTVNTAYDIRRLSFEVGVNYDTHIETAKQVIYQAVKKCKTVSDKQPPIVVITQLAESAINLRILWAIEDGTQAHALQSLDEVINQVKTDLTEAAIDMPYSTQRIIMVNDANLPNTNFQSNT